MDAPVVLDDGHTDDNSDANVSVEEIQKEIKINRIGASK